MWASSSQDETTKDVDAERSKYLISKTIFFLLQPPWCNFCFFGVERAKKCCHASYTQSFQQSSSQIFEQSNLVSETFCLIFFMLHGFKLNEKWELLNGGAAAWNLSSGSTALVRRGLSGVITDLWRTLLNNGEVIIIYCYVTNVTEQQIMPARIKANGNFREASLERFYSVSINRVMSLRNDHKNNIIGPCDSPVTAYLNFRRFTETFS